MNFLRTLSILVLVWVLIMGSLPGLANHSAAEAKEADFGSEMSRFPVAPGPAIDPYGPCEPVRVSLSIPTSSLYARSTVAAGDLPPGVDDSLVYAIITDPDNVQALDPLAEWKTKKGLRAQVFTTDDIYDNYAGRDHPEDIRLFLQDLINETTVQYLLLAGDIDTVPTRYAYCNDPYSGDGTDVPTDTYYGFLEGSWDDNEDNRFADLDNDNVVWDPDIYVGRLPDSSKSGLEDLVQNILDYEKSPPWGSWAETALLAGAYSNFDEDTNGNNEKDAGDYDKTDEAKLCFTIEDWLLPGNIDTIRLYENEGLDPTDYEYDHGLTTANISSSLNYGQSLVNLAGHGSDTGVHRTIWNNDADGDDLCDPGSEQSQPVFMDTSVSPSNNEKRPLVYINACNSGAFDKSRESLAEHVVNDFGIGAVAASRVSWYSVGWDPQTDGGSGNQGHAYRFWEQFFAGNWGPGEALYESKHDYVNDKNLDIYTMKNLLNYNLMGDPQLPVLTASPGNLTVDHPVNVSSNEEKLVLEVVDGLGDPVKWARATLINNELYLTALTDANGKLEFQFTQDIDSNFQLTVTAHNFLPYESGIVAVHPPVLEDVSFSVAQAYRGKDTVKIFMNGSDDKYDEDELDCQIEYKAPSGDWTPLDNGSFDKDRFFWTLFFTPDTGFDIGNYDFRARLVDLDEAASDWQEFTGAVEVLNNLPTALDLRLSFGTVNRTESVVIQVDGSDLEDTEDHLFYQLLYRSPTGDWTLIDSGNYVEGSWEFQFDTKKSMELGLYDFRVQFTDTDTGESDWLERTDVLEVKNIGPEALINDIIPGKVDQGGEVSFSGSGSDPDGSVTAYSWRSDLDAFLGDQQSFSLLNLSNGTHLIYLKVMDSDGTWSKETSANVTVNGIPRPFIESLSSKVVLEGETVVFQGNGSDDGEINLYRWDSSLDGTLYRGPQSIFNTSTLKLGEHLISLQVRDSDGTWSEGTNTTLVVHEPPVAYILEITPNPALTTQKLLFQGEGSDDGNVSHLWWRIVNSEGLKIMNGSEVPEKLDAGNYTIYFQVQDNYGAWSNEMNRSLVVHRKPVAFIIRVKPTLAIEGENLHFEGGGNDDGQLLQYSWRTKDGKNLHNGSESSFSHGSFLTGNHTVYLKVMDNFGVWSDEVSATVAVYEKPVAEVVEVLPGVVLEGELVRFCAIEMENRVQYAWFSNIDGELYNGSEANSSCAHLSQGDHTIILKIKDGVWSDGVTTTVKVHRKPVGTLTSISPNPAKPEEAIRFSGVGSDDGSIVRYVWHSDIDGVFYNNSLPSAEDIHLSLGVHEISFLVQDDNGAWSDRVHTTLTVEEESVDTGSEEFILFWEVGPFPIFAYLGLLLAMLLGLVLTRRKGKNDKDRDFTSQAGPDNSLDHSSFASPPQAGPSLSQPGFAPFPPPQTPATGQTARPVVHNIPTQRAPQQPARVTEAVNWNCSACGQQIQGKFKFCIYCGTRRF